MNYIFPITFTTLGLLVWFLYSRKGKSNPSDKKIEKKNSIKIYTKTGDRGTTSLYNGERRCKSDVIFSVLGDLDELSAHIGFLRMMIFDNEINLFLKHIQSRLLDVGSAVATPRDNSSEFKINKTVFNEEYVDELENYIDEFDKTLPDLTRFIIPGGNKTSAYIHICRCVSRRVERGIWVLINCGQVNDIIGKYINRLSDYFFVLARYTLSLNSIEDDIYVK